MTEFVVSSDDHSHSAVLRNTRAEQHVDLVSGSTEAGEVLWRLESVRGP